MNSAMCQFDATERENWYRCRQCGRQMWSDAHGAEGCFAVCGEGADAGLVERPESQGWRNVVEERLVEAAEFRTREEVDDLIESHCAQCDRFDRQRGCRKYGACADGVHDFVTVLIYRGMGCGRWSERNQRETATTAAEPVRVGFVTPGLNLGGAERWIASLVRCFEAERVTPAGVAVMGGVREELAGPIRRRCSIERGAAGVAALAARADVLVVWGMTLEAIPATFGGPIVLVSHGHGPWTADLLAKSEGRVTHRAAVSRWAAQAFVDPATVEVIHNGVDVPRCRPLVPREHVRAAWGLRPGEIAIGSMGRLSWEKHPLAAALAAAALGPPYRAVYSADGWREQEIRPLLKLISPDAVIQPAVDQVGDVLGGLDCFVLASPSEGFSLGLTEAWLCGVPTVATRVGAVPELEERFGRLVEPVAIDATADDLAAAVRRAVSAANRRTVARARRVAAAGYTASHMARRWEGYLQRIVQEHRRAAG